jgi:hypothetical protein
MENYLQLTQTGRFSISHLTFLIGHWKTKPGLRLRKRQMALDARNWFSNDQ